MNRGVVYSESRDAERRADPHPRRPRHLPRPRLPDRADRHHAGGVAPCRRRDRMERHVVVSSDRESLTRRFFTKFRDAVRDVAAALPGDGSDEALLILSRLLFLSFVQEKGWLNGERRFLFDRLGTPNYFTNVLRPLFFGCLNTATADRDEAARRLGNIPYLNGGLFEPSPYE